MREREREKQNESKERKSWKSEEEEEEMEMETIDLFLFDSIRFDSFAPFAKTLTGKSHNDVDIRRAVLVFG